MPERSRKKRPTDLNKLAASIVNDATDPQPGTRRPLRQFLFATPRQNRMPRRHAHSSDPDSVSNGIDGTPDFANDIVLTGRSRQGSPGVYIFTPVRRSGSDSAVLVLRGWVYSPDAATVDLTRWHERRRSFGGYVLALPASVDSPQQPAMERKVRALTRERVRELVPYPVSTRYLVSQDSVAAAAADSTPARVAQPSLDDGPHLSYAIQWFSFAAIALIGSYVVIRRTRSVGSPSA